MRRAFRRLRNRAPGSVAARLAAPTAQIYASRLARPGLLAFALCAFAGCDLPGRPAPGPEVPRPDQVMDSARLYHENCSGCHGVNGEYGPATPLANPEYQALVDDATLHTIIAHGMPGTLMPGFAASAGGTLTDAQIDSIIRGMRQRWFKGNVLAGANAPSYTPSGPGDPRAGAAVFSDRCALCHGPASGEEGPAGSITNGSFLKLIAPQSIRTTVIVGRPDLGMPDWRNQIPGKPLSEADVDNVVAYLAAQTPTRPGQPYQAPEPPRHVPPQSVSSRQQGIHGRK